MRSAQSGLAFLFCNMLYYGEQIRMVVRIKLLYLGVYIVVMNTKLTLKLDSETIELAKSYARESNISLSKLIENYLKALVKEKASDREVNPIVESLTGVISLDGSVDHKESYRKYLIEKYK